MLLVGCSAVDNPYPGLSDKGFTFKVRYDVGDGMFASTNNVTIVDVVKAEDVQKGMKLLEPGSSDRGEEGANLSTPSNSGYFLMGWYKSRKEHKDADGNQLDVYGNRFQSVYKENDKGEGYYINQSTDAEGNLIIESGAVKAYEFSDMWDFSTDKVTEEMFNEKGEFTLYAAWVPYFTYTFYNGTEKIGTYSFNPVVQSLELNLPSWNETTGKQDLNDLKAAAISGKTFEGAYLDPACTQNAEGFTHTGSVDASTGLSIAPNVDIYTTWKDGVWFKITEAKQFVSNSRIDGCYEILADLDFAGLNWSNGLAAGDFSGKIIGNGFAMKNITVTQTNTSQTYGGMFGRIVEGAVIENVKFQSVTYKLSSGSRQVSASFGVLAGNISEAATVTDVALSGSLLIGNIVTPYAKYDIGLVSGNGVNCGIDLSGITCLADEVTVGYDEDGYPVKGWAVKIAEVASDGFVTVEGNADTSVNPNV